MAIIPHLHQWEEIAKVYNDESNEYLNILGDVDRKYVVYANEKEPSKFDELNAHCTILDHDSPL